MEGNRKVIGILFLLVLFWCSCGIGHIADETVESEKTVEEPTAEEPEAMPEMVFILTLDFYWEKDSNQGSVFISFFDNQGNVYSLRDPYVNDMSYKELCGEFAEGKLDDLLTLCATCELDELRENYELLKEVAQNEEFKCIPEGRDFYPEVIVPVWYWGGFYYQEDGTLAYLTIREKSTHGSYCISRPNDERAEQIYEWLASVSEIWDQHNNRMIR